MRLLSVYLNPVTHGVTLKRPPELMYYYSNRKVIGHERFSPLGHFFGWYIHNSFTTKFR